MQPAAHICCNKSGSKQLQAPDVASTNLRPRPVSTPTHPQRCHDKQFTYSNDWQCQLLVLLLLLLRKAAAAAARKIVIISILYWASWRNQTQLGNLAPSVGAPNTPDLHPSFDALSGKSKLVDLLGAPGLFGVRWLAPPVYPQGELCEGHPVGPLEGFNLHLDSQVAVIFSHCCWFLG